MLVCTVVSNSLETVYPPALSVPTASARVSGNDWYPDARMLRSSGSSACMPLRRYFPNAISRSSSSTRGGAAATSRDAARASGTSAYESRSTRSRRSMRESRALEAASSFSHCSVSRPSRPRFSASARETRERICSTSDRRSWRSSIELTIARFPSQELPTCVATIPGSARWAAPLRGGLPAPSWSRLIAPIVATPRHHPR